MKTKTQRTEEEQMTRRTIQAMNQPEQPIVSMWAVMRAHAWDRIEVGGLKLVPPPGGPHRFIPVFETREQAIAWAGSDEHVAELVMESRCSTRNKLPVLEGSKSGEKPHACDFIPPRP